MSAFNPEKITLFAKTDARGKEVPFGIKAKDRQRHMYIVGKTGMGKSTLLENMAVQDIQTGEGMAFIDPHGSAAETLLEYVPEHRVNDVIYFAPFDLDNPISFNVMEDVGEDKRHLVVSGLMSTFKKIWVDAWSARMEYILTNALLALIEYPDTTLLSVNRLFSDKHYRERVVNYIKDPAVKSFWTEEFANYTDRFAAEALPAIQNKIGQFTGNPLIRNIIGQPHSSFDIREIMDQRKILIMNLSKGLVGETNANLLGSMLTTRIYLAAMSRADLPVHVMQQMPNFYFYVDEFQSFANATFANILSEARKYHLNLIIAHQYIAQMEEEVRDAVFGNVGTTVTFRVGPFDAEVLEPVFTPRFLATDLVNLGFVQIYLTLMIDGIGSLPFSATTLPPISKPHISCRDMVIAASRRNFTKPRAIVEQIITDLHAPVVPPPKIKMENGTGNSGNNVNSSGRSRQSVPGKNGNNGNSVSRQPGGERSEPSRRVRADASVTEHSERHTKRVRTEIPTLENNSYEKFSSKPERRTDNPAKPSVADLRAVLAKLAQTSENEVSPEKRETKTTLNHPTTPLTESKKPAPARLVEAKDSLKAALASTLVKHEVEVNAQKQMSSSPSPDERVTTVTSPEHEVAKLAAEADALYQVLTESPSAPPVQVNQPDPKTVARLLKGSRERSPFR
jgi:hypothetical protein